MTTAALANDLQGLSQGRFMLGLGTQVRAHITRRFSMPWSQPAARMREYVMALRAIWSAWHDGAPLDFQGDFYTHTLMTPMFTPGEHGYGTPPVYLAGVGLTMTETAGEVADGFLAHGFTTEKYLREVTIPALRRGRERAGASMNDFTISGFPFIVTGNTEEEMTAAAVGARERIAFYASTPAYLPVLELHGWAELGHELHTLSKAGEWTTMGTLIDDDVLNAFAVVAEPDGVAAGLVSRYGDVMDRATLYLPYEVDDATVNAIVGQIRAAAPAGNLAVRANERATA
jgi:probable F420-dependent oxidoreductase